MKEIIVINKSNLLGHEIDVYGTVDEPLFKAKDVAEWIEHSNPRMMLESVDEDEKGVRNTYTPGGNQEMWFLTEDGLYEVLMQSRKPIAKQFKKGIKTILKEIRKNGGYMAMSGEESEEDLMARALVVARATLKRREERIKRLEAKSEEDAPKVEFFESVAESKDAIEMKAVATTLNYKKVGRNKLFEILRNNKVLQQNNQPYQKYVDCGFFRTIEQKYEKNGEVCINIKTLVYQKGLDFIRKMLNRLGYRQSETTQKYLSIW